MKFRQGYIDLELPDPGNNLRMHYEEVGEEDAPVLLLLHGGGVTGPDNWKPFVKLNDFDLTKSFRIVMPDHRGHGKTNNPRGTFLSYKEMADDMAAFIEQMKLRRPTVMGHSSGALTSLHLSIFYPHLVDRQILIGIHPNLGISKEHKDGLKNIYGTKNYLKPPTKWQLIRHNVALAIWLWWMHSAVNWHKLISTAWPMWAAPLGLKRNDQGQDSDYQRVKCSTLVVWGKDEEFGSSDDHQLLQDWIPGSEGVLVERDPPNEKVLHLFVVDQPEKLRDAVLPFLL